MLAETLNERKKPFSLLVSREQLRFHLRKVRAPTVSYLSLKLQCISAMEMDQPSGKGAIHTGSPQSFMDFRPISPHFTQPIRIFRPKKTLSLDVLYARSQNKIDCPVVRQSSSPSHTLCQSGWSWSRAGSFARDLFTFSPSHKSGFRLRINRRWSLRPKREQPPSRYTLPSYKKCATMGDDDEYKAPEIRKFSHYMAHPLCQLAEMLS